MSQTDCPDGMARQRFVLGELDESSMTMFADHLEQCEECRRSIEDGFQQGVIASALKAVPVSIPLIGGETQGAETADRWRYVPRTSNSTGPDDNAQRIMEAGLELERLGHFRILKLLGQGGMGQVYLAEDSRLKRRVALKVIREKYSSSDDSHRFQAEAEAVAKLTHPGIVPIHEVGEDAGRRYLTMAFIEGETLAQRLTAGPLPSRDAGLLLHKVTCAVAYAHSQGVIHRDLKPGNILLDQQGQPLVADFGLAKRHDSDSQLTQSGQILGTPSYMPPEQAQSKNDQVGPRADVYSLGATLYCLLTGRPPFQAANVVETLKLVVEREPVAPRQLNPAVDRDLETICLKCLEKRPEKRYASADELAEELSRFLDHRAILARPIGPFGKLARWAQRNPVLSGSLAFSIVVFFIAFVFVLWSYVRTGAALAEEARQLAAAVRATEEAQKQEKAERWSRYLANIAAASSALRLNNVTGAKRFLGDAPKEHHGWEWQHLVNQLDDAALVLRGHVGEVTLVCYSPDGRRLATTGIDNTVRVWDSATGKGLQVLPSKYGASALAFSNDGARLACGSRRGAHIWDWATGQQVFDRAAPMNDVAVIPIGAHNQSINSEHFSSSPKVHFVDASTGQEIGQMTHDGWINAFAAVVSGRLLATASDDKTVHLLDTRNGKTQAVLRGHQSFVNSVCFSPDGKQLLSGGGFPDNSLRLWNVATGELMATLSGHTNAIPCLAYSPNGARFASGSYDQSVRLWEGATGKPVATLSGHTGWVNDVAFSPSGKHLVSAGQDRTLRLWNGTTGDFLTVLRGHAAAVNVVTIRPDGRHAASASADGTVRLWDIERLAQRGTLRGHTNFIYAVNLSPDGKHVASAGWDGTLRVWSLDTRRELACMIHPGSAVVIALACGADGRHIATYARDGAVHWWDWESGKEVRAFKLPTYCAETDVAINPKGDRVAVGGADGRIHIWETATGAAVAVLSEGAATLVRSVAYDPRGQRLASASNNQAAGIFVVRIWDVERQETLKVLTGHTERIYNVGFSNDGRWLASSSIDGTVHLWDAKSLDSAAVLPHGCNVYKVAFSPDGRRLATACADNTVRLWDLITFQEVAELHGHDSYVHGLAWSADGTRLVTGGGDHTIRIWESRSVLDSAARTNARLNGK